MTKISVLLENSSINDQYVPKHGLSILIEFNGDCLLLDTGPDNKFISNAEKMDIDLSKVQYLFLSHSHYDHTGGLNDFIKANNSARIFLTDSIDSKYYAKSRFFKTSIGLNLKKANRSRITQLNDDLIIDNKIYFLKNIVSEYQKPTFNKVLYKKDKGKMVQDSFNHEGILVLDDNNELLIFNSCSHNGILNVIETVKRKIPDKKIRAYTGGLHLCNPSTKQHESDEYLDFLVNEIRKMNIIIYTGHCTGKYPADYLKEKLGEKIQKINTGMRLNI